jgi:tRNA threonylcarbamoyladenosine biosynthesis protein TsaB
MIGGANPVVLGLDTATAATAVALRLGDGSTAQLRDDPRPGDHPGHATRLLEMAHELLARADVAWKDVDRIAVGVGPGTFTGLRVGVATARGLAQSLSAELVGVSSLQALAAAALEGEEQSHTDSILAVIDARRGEVFAAAYERSASGAPPRELTAPRALAPEQLTGVLASAQAEDRVRRWLALGDGAVRYSEHVQLAGVPCVPAASPLQSVSAATISQLGAWATPAGSWDEIVPDYRRRPDAELALEGAQTGSVSST